MSEGSALPRSLHGFRLVRTHHFLGRLILWIIIILIILWFVKRELVIELKDWILSLIQK